MKHFSIDSKIKGKLNWFTIRFLIFKISIAVLGVKNFSLRFETSWGFE